MPGGNRPIRRAGRLGRGDAVTTYLDEYLSTPWPAPTDPTEARTTELVRLMELAFTTGSYARVLTVMRQNKPYATDESFLLACLRSMPTQGWACWDTAVALVAFLRRDGIEAGVTTAFGAEDGAPAQPHALVRVTRDDGTSFLADPHFGIGALTREDYFMSLAARADIVSPQWQPYTEVVHVAHKAYPRAYRYHVLPGVLTRDQLTAMLWQAGEYGDLKVYMRAVGGGRIWHLTREGYDDGEVRTWPHSRLHTAPSVTTGNWFGLMEEMEAATATDRLAALSALFQD